MHKRKYIIAFLLLSIPTGLVIFFHAVLGSYSRFLADDYCVAAVADQLGLLKSIWFWYTNWSGGYSTSIADYFLAITGTKGVSFVPVIVLITWFALTGYVITSALPKNINGSDKFLASFSLTSLVLFLTLTLTPNVPQSLYWWTGMRAYILPIIILTFYMAIYQWLDNRGWNKKETLLWSAISFVITFLNSGFAETFTPMQFVFFAMIIALIVFTKPIKIGSPSFYFLLSGLLGSLTGLIAMVAAPGNSIRQGGFPPSPDIFNILRISIHGYFDYVKWAFLTPHTATALIGTMLGATWFGINNPNDMKLSRFFSAFLMAGFFFAFLCFPPSAYGMSMYPPPRTLSFFAFAITVFFILASYLGGSWLSEKVNLASRPTVTTTLLIAGTILIGYSSWFTIHYLNQSKPYFVSYAQIWDSNHAKILKVKMEGKKTAVIEPLYNWAQLQDPTKDRNYSVNVCMKNYYGIYVVTK